jgi:poly-gamma-glutamate synthesis protein (capsule biosynthesis protein)
MSPENAACLSAAAIDCCVLANNHILDWERAGLLDTLATLERLHIKYCGAGRDLPEASAPAALKSSTGRILVISLASPTSGAPRSWQAKPAVPGVNILAEMSAASAARLAEQIARERRPEDIIVVSIHWGPNWGYDIPDEQRDFAHALVDKADVSIVYGHSSHHRKAIEVYRKRLILYGCGDFIDDYEGISGYDEFRGDLVLMYFALVDAVTRDLIELEMTPLQMRRFQLVRPAAADATWLLKVLDRECQAFGARVKSKPDGRFRLAW